ncbi:unnamed protein product [Paramecium sonneborni]|uniref:Transmembrane protein n=1 Tax=Paramecium sonneborni TaxID=65129 RepID=A0A8S1RRV7_9CILI|nr:unnamed protein product [Paramecium sonneborni]
MLTNKYKEEPQFRGEFQGNFLFELILFIISLHIFFLPIKNFDLLQLIFNIYLLENILQLIKILSRLQSFQIFVQKISAKRKFKSKKFKWTHFANLKIIRPTFKVVQRTISGIVLFQKKTFKVSLNLQKSKYIAKHYRNYGQALMFK